METDRIEKKVLLKSSRARVWRALTDAKEFGSWFGMELDGPFVAGTTLRGRISPTTVDPEVAELQKSHKGKAVELAIDKIDAERLFSFRWHPYAVDPAVDYSKEPTTLVTFTLEEKAEGVLLTIAETGFDKIPLSRRAQALKANDGGWAKQAELVSKYLSREK
jgi:uncharacterized protein YndB with AHSA1/START domain